MELYKISFPVHAPGKVYIGISSKSAQARFKEHRSSRKPYPIACAFRKYGAENALLEVLGVFDSFDELYAAEQQAIKDHNSKAPSGYNLTDGGKGAFGLPVSEDRRMKISLANTGRKASAETKRKISEANKLRDFSVQVQAMANANRGVKKSPEVVDRMRATWIGRKHSEESKQRMSESASKRKASDETRRAMSLGIKMAKGGKVFQFIGPDGSKVDVFNMKEFCQKNGLTTVHMYNVAAGKAMAHKGWRSVSVE